MVKGSYYGSMWTMLAETAIDTGQKVTIPADFVL
jgi:hypothetical protein